ncbi:Hypothetical predicted protein [Olea europaea subsp. europaea]|uniref:Uncharacterized protein n=1 Tax=Olea europaea subsp. europaea TaxID=158383 RepID=A0A8S0QWG9_OLEEU|nr:Hypothetical predicted protein [Olea europaea subsp. europaea]
MVSLGYMIHPEERSDLPNHSRRRSGSTPRVLHNFDGLKVGFLFWDGGGIGEGDGSGTVGGRMRNEGAKDSGEEKEEWWL